MRRPLLPYLASCLLLLACGTDESGLEELSSPSAGGSSSGGSSAGTSAGGSIAGPGGSSQGGVAGSSSQGGNNSAGTSSAGTDAGGTNAGGTDAGGSNAGGTDAGGTNAGGTDAGGTDAGGTNSGGTDAGGSDAGGSSAGGTDAGGTDAGGTSSGGTDAGGTNAGGANSGGTNAGGSSSGGSSSGGTGGSAAGGAGNGGSGGSLSGGSGGAPACGTGFSDACGTCLSGSCCAEAEACDENCRACLAGDSTAQNCAGNAKAQALAACAQQSCKGACFQGGGGPLSCDVPKPASSGGSCVQIGSNGFNCNPVTNAGCTNPGAACDAGNNGGFVCYDSGNTQDVCAQCGQQSGYCKPGATCEGGNCAAYCCDDSDCNGGRCDKQGYPEGQGVVGLCKEATFSGTDPCEDDLHEPNESANSAEKLTTEDDCSFQNNLSVQGAISSAQDKDWFQLDFDDTNQCQLAPTFQFQGNSGIRVCAYFKCKNGSTTAGQQVQCFNGDAPSNSDLGPGCCTTDGNLTPQLNCTGEDDSATVQFRVESTNSNACLPYRVRYGF